MRTIILGSAVAVVLSTAASFAQQRPAPTAEPAHNVFVLTGCLMSEAKATPVFKLTDAEATGRAIPPAAEPGAVGTSGRVGTPGQKPSYELRPVSGVGAQGIDADGLKAHVGHRVEVVVRPVEAPAPAAAPAGAAIEAARPIEPAPERYTVTTIKRVVGRCS